VVVKLTKKQSQAFAHRIEASDTVSGVLEEEYGFDAELVELVCDKLIEGLTSSGLDTSFAEAVAPIEVVREVVAEAVEGSTWAACAVGQTTDQAERGAYRTLEGLAERLEPYVGRPLDVM
jgi:hypothetical protein